MHLSCQVSNVTLVERCWERFYASVITRVIKPVDVHGKRAFEPSWEFEQAVDEPSVEVLDAPFHLALVSRVRRMSKMSLNIMIATPALPSLPKLRTKITQNSLRKPPFLFKHRHGFSRRRVTVKLFSRNDKTAEAIDANKKPVFLTLHSK